MKVQELCARRSSWSFGQVEASTSGIPSIASSPDGYSLLVATTDLGFSLLDTRRSGACVLTLATESPLQCCAFDGETGLGGCSDGQVRPSLPLEA